MTINKMRIEKKNWMYTERNLIVFWCKRFLAQKKQVKWSLLFLWSFWNVSTW